MRSTASLVCGRDRRRAPIAFAIALSLSVLAGCVTPVPVTLSVPARTPLRVMADSASHLATHVADASDTASMEISLAIAESDSLRLERMVARARSASRNASTVAGTAIAQGDRLRDILVDSLSGAGRDYARYWALGRGRLDAARQHADEAAQEAERSLACQSTSCRPQVARAMRSHATAAADAAREAESVVRIAMTYVN